MVRCFVGIPMPPSYQKNLQALTDMFRVCLKSRVSWTRTGNLHLTLKFLGEVDPVRLEQVRQALSLVEFDSFAFRAGASGCYPDRRNPRVIWKALMKGGRGCADLAMVLDECLHPLGFKAAEKDFLPHLTIGRVKEAREDDWDQCLTTMDNGNWPEVETERFVLWKSELSPQGPTYTPLAEYPLVTLQR